MKRLACLLACALAGLVHAAPALAQQSGPQPLDGPDSSFGFFTRYDFQLEANLLSGNDGARYRWDTHFGGEFDVINYVKGRITVVTDYEAVLGSELRPFDPNQGNYILEPAASWFAGKNEVAFVFHHVSRHFSDRPKLYAVAWNVVEGRYLRKFDVNGTSIAVRAGAGRIVQHSDVDYTWTTDWDVMARRRMNPHVEWYGRLTGEVFGVDPAMAGINPLLVGRTDVQKTARVEIGTRLTGKKADLELFVGVERRADASPVDYLPQTWGIVGFRIASK